MCKKIEDIVKRVEADLGKRKLNICFKIFFPFYTPHLSIIACLYDIVLLSFAIFFFVGQVDPRAMYSSFNQQNVTTAAYPEVIDSTSLIYDSG